jgi:hypothetical protein
MGSCQNSKESGWTMAVLSLLIGLALSGSLVYLHFA